MTVGALQRFELRSSTNGTCYSMWSYTDTNKSHTKRDFFPVCTTNHICSNRSHLLSAKLLFVFLTTASRIDLRARPRAAYMISKHRYRTKTDIYVEDFLSCAVTLDAAAISSLTQPSTDCRCVFILCTLDLSFVKQSVRWKLLLLLHSPTYLCLEVQKDAFFIHCVHVSELRPAPT